MPYGKKKDSAAKMGHEKSPAEMGHKGDSPAKMESAKQERKNLLQDNPVAKHASGSWLSKHAGHSRMSPAKMDHSPLNDNHELIVYPDRKNQKGESQVDIMNKRPSDANTAIDAYNKGTGTRNAAEDATKRYNFSRDSISNVNVKIDKLLGGLDKKRKDILSGKH